MPSAFEAGCQKIPQWDKQGYVRLSETIGCECDWRIIADHLYKKDYIEYPGGATYSSLGRITQKGINYIEKKYG